MFTQLLSIWKFEGRESNEEFEVMKAFSFIEELYLVVICTFLFCFDWNNKFSLELLFASKEQFRDRKSVV